MTAPTQTSTGAAGIRMTHPMTSISDELAVRIVQAARAAGDDTEHRFAICVVDPAGVLKAFLRQDGAPVNAVQIAQDKAYTAATSGMDTATWAHAIESDPVLGRGALGGIDRLLALGGGLPITVEGQVVGAVGVSGAHYDDDLAVARAGLAVLP